MAKTAKIKGAPVYRVTIDEGVEGMTKVSLVDFPAVEKDFQALAREKAPLKYAVQDEEKRIVRGVLIRADFPIYRNDKKRGEYYIVFEKDTIRQIAEQYMADGLQNAVNQMHEDDSDVTGVDMVQFFIKDTAAGVDPAGFEDIEDGSLFAEYHVVNEEVWDRVKDGTFKGFSIEIEHYIEPIEEGEETYMAAELLTIISKHKNMPGIIAKLKAAFTEIVSNAMKTDTSDKGVVAWDGDEALKVGDALYIVDDKGEQTAAPDGDYTLSDKSVATVEDGKVTAIKEAEEPESEDGGAGDTTETAETKAAKENPRVSLFAKIRNAFEESYDEKMRRIVGAIVEARNAGDDEYGWLVTAGDDFAVWCYYGEATDWYDKYVRYAVTWNEDGSANVSDPRECREAFVPIDFDDASAWNREPAETENASQLRADIDEIAGIVTGLVSVVKGHGEAITKLSNVPAAKPAAKAFKEAMAAAKKGEREEGTALERLRKHWGV